MPPHRSFRPGGRSNDRPRGGPGGKPSRPGQKPGQKSGYQPRSRPPEAAGEGPPRKRFGKPRPGRPPGAPGGGPGGAPGQPAGGRFPGKTPRFPRPPQDAGPPRDSSQTGVGVEGAAPAADHSRPERPQRFGKKPFVPRGRPDGAPPRARTSKPEPFRRRRPEDGRPAVSRSEGGRPADGRRNDRRPAKRRDRADRPQEDREEDFRQRLQKVMASHGLGSRRSCEELILAGRVEIDGQAVTELGTRVDPARQEIRVDSELLPKVTPLYYVLNKPAGVVATSRDPSGRPTVTEMVPDQDRLFTVGRLDMFSEGLVLMTNDGELAHRLTHPRFGIEKTYIVQVAGQVGPTELELMRRGVHLAEGVVRARHVHIRRSHKQSTLLEVVLSEGRNREIRRMLARLGHKVQRLTRIAIGPLRLGQLLPGEFRPITKEEYDSLQHAAFTAPPAEPTHYPGFRRRGKALGSRIRNKTAMPTSTTVPDVDRPREEPADSSAPAAVPPREFRADRPPGRRFDRPPGGARSGEGRRDFRQGRTPGGRPSGSGSGGARDSGSSRPGGHGGRRGRPSGGKPFGKKFGEQGGSRPPRKGRRP